MMNTRYHTNSYDKANQLVSSTTDGKVTHYAYDAAGRLIKEGDKSYSYGWFDKVLSVTENGQQIASFNYHNDGQIAQAIHNGKSEDFFWDGLALIHRGKTSFINEPYFTGGNPILSSKDGVMFNDMLGSTLNIGGRAVNMTAFGESTDSNAMYTGKPYIGELGYAFLFRNYRSDYGKWQTTDPLGYPDGWNNLAYVNNGVTIAIDWLGAKIYDLCDRNAVGGYGHSAQIVTVQNNNGSWSAYTYDYGQGSSGSGATFNNTISTSSSEAGARDAAIQQLDPTGKKYDNMSEWDANNQQSNAAKSAMDNYVNGAYNPGWHNCRGVLNDGLEAAGYVKGTDFSAKTAPALANTEDVNLSARDLTKTLKSIQRRYAE